MLVGDVLYNMEEEIFSLWNRMLKKEYNKETGLHFVQNLYQFRIYVTLLFSFQIIIHTGSKETHLNSYFAGKT